MADRTRSSESGSNPSNSAAAGFEQIRQLVRTLIEQRNDLHVRLRQSQTHVETLTRENQSLRPVSGTVSGDRDIEQRYIEQLREAQQNQRRALFAARQRRALEFELMSARRLIEDLLDQNGLYRGLVKKLKTSLEGWVGWFLRNGGSTGPEHERPRPYVDRREQQATPRPGPEWIRGNWLPDPDPSSKSLLAEAEDLYRRHHDQEALTEVSKVLSNTDVSDVAYAHAQLLLAAILCACNNPGPALYHAEAGFILANRLGWSDLASKAQFHRGVAFLGLLKFAEASYCFSLAEDASMHAEEITLWKARAETARLRFEEGHPKRVLGSGFVPQPTR